MDSNIDMETIGNGYALCLRNKKRRSFNLVDPSSLMTMASWSSIIVGTSSSTSPFWFRCPSSYKLCDCFMFKKIFLVGFQPPRKVIYINKEILHDIYI